MIQVRVAVFAVPELVFCRQSNVVPHPYSPCQVNVPVEPVVLTAAPFGFGKIEQNFYPLVCDYYHAFGPPPLAAAALELPFGSRAAAGGILLIGFHLDLLRCGRKQMVITFCCFYVFMFLC